MRDLVAFQFQIARRITLGLAEGGVPTAAIVCSELITLVFYRTWSEHPKMRREAL